MPKSAQQSQIAEQKFRPLKKELQKILKKMRWDIDDNHLPDQQLVEEFVRQVEVMVSYPGFGDEFYAGFLNACRALPDFMKSRDLSGFLQQFRTIQALRRECHDRFRLTHNRQ